MEQRKPSQLIRGQNQRIKKITGIQFISSIDLFNLIHKEAPETYKYSFILYSLDKKSEMNTWQNTIRFTDHQVLDAVNDQQTFTKLAESTDLELWKKRKRVYNIIFASEADNQVIQAISALQSEQTGIEEIEERVKQCKDTDEETKAIALRSIKLFKFLKQDKIREVFIAQESLNRFIMHYPFHLRIMPLLSKLFLMVPWPRFIELAHFFF